MTDICFNTDAIVTIDVDDCIGTSLGTINNNVKLLEENIKTVSNGTTELETEFTQISSNILSLSSTIGGIPKAYISFRGNSVSPNDLFVFDSYNISKVIRTSTGMFSLSFITPFLDDTYALLGMCKETQSGGEYVWVQPTTYSNLSASINISSTTSATLTNPEYVSIVVYSL